MGKWKKVEARESSAWSKASGLWCFDFFASSEHEMWTLNESFCYNLSPPSFQEPSEPSEPLRVTSVKAPWQHVESCIRSIDPAYHILSLWGSLGHFWTLGHWVLELQLHILITLALNTLQWLRSWFSLPFLDQVEGKATIQRIELSYSDGSIWAMGPPVARAKKAAKAKNRKDDGVRVMAALLQLILFYRFVQYQAKA